MKKVLKVVANKYFITGFAFVVWCAFFDQNDWFSLRDKQKDLNALKANIAFLNKEIDNMDEEHNALLHDDKKLEQYARENYRMKRDSEDVYVIEN